MDTMYSAPFSFRKKLDKIKKGVLLQSQFHPVKNHPTEFITSSWDEYWSHKAMPEVDVFRFMLPEHIAPMVSRWQRFEGKTELINRAIFGAAPIIIWTDIFGRIMDYSEEQKKRICEWKATYMKYREIFQGKASIPVYYKGDNGLYCNLFSDGGLQSIYSFYNEGCKNITDEIDLWQDASEATVIIGNGISELKGDKIKITLPPETVVQILVK